jgi:hypothetical protein
MKTLVLVAALSLVSLGIAAQNTPQNHANAKGANAEHVVGGAQRASLRGATGSSRR